MEEPRRCLSLPPQGLPQVLCFFLKHHIVIYSFRGTIFLPNFTLLDMMSLGLFPFNYHKSKKSCRNWHLALILRLTKDRRFWVILKRAWGYFKVLLNSLFPFCH